MVPGSLLAIVLGAAGAIPEAWARDRVRPYSKVEGWRVSTMTHKGRTTGCVAATDHPDGTTFIVGYGTRWWLGLSNGGWKNTAARSLTVQILVDGKVVHQATAAQKDRLVVMELGQEADRLAAFMSGQTITFVTANGRTSFSLKGSGRATVAVADCVKRQSAGAVAAARGGAFGSSGLADGGSANKSAALGLQRRVAPRSETLELATTYLAKLGTPYTVLEPTANVLKNFPVNWTFADGGFGGMVIYTGASPNGQKFFDEFVADNARLCKGTSALERHAPFLNDNQQITRYSAIGTCQENERAYLTDFTVLAGPDLVVAIVNIGKLGGDGTLKRQEQNRKWSL